MSSNIDIDNASAAGQRDNTSSEGLTFGIELEFVALIPKKIAEKHKNVPNYVRNLLSKARVARPCDNPKCKKKEHKFFLPVQGDIQEVYSYDLWNVDVDGSVHLENAEDDYDHSISTSGSMELISRVQKFEGSSLCPKGQTYPCDNTRVLEWTWREEIKAFTDVLGRAFTKDGYRALVNGRTGFHVHLGQGPKGLPLPAVRGLTGTMLALERCFDSVLPTNRISGDNNHSSYPLPGLDIDGFHALYKPGEVIANQDFDIWNCRAISCAMFHHVRWEIGKTVQGFNNSSATTVDSSYSITSDDVTSIEESLSSFNVPAWLEYIKSKPTVDEVKDVTGTHAKNVALNCRGLGEFPTDNKPTAECRLGAGTLDYTEISAWVDFLGNLTLWTEQTDKDELFDYLVQSWRDPAYTICDLAHKVNASGSTIDLFSYMLSTHPWVRNLYAQDRFDKHTSLVHNPADKLNAVTVIVERNRLAVSGRLAVDEKIRWKLESGRYGQMPTSFLEAQPNNGDLMRPEAKFLHLNEGTENGWVKFMQDYYEKRFGLKVTLRENSPPSNSKPEETEKPMWDKWAPEPEDGEKPEVEAKPEGGEKPKDDAEVSGDEASVHEGAIEESRGSPIEWASSNGDKDDEAESKTPGGPPPKAPEAPEYEPQTPENSPPKAPTAPEAESPEAPETEDVESEAAESEASKPDSFDLPESKSPEVPESRSPVAPEFEADSDSTESEASKPEPSEAAGSPIKEQSSEAEEAPEFVEYEDDQNDKFESAATSPIKEESSEAQEAQDKSVETESEYDSDGFYGIHPALATAYNEIPGQHLSHLESTVLNMPDLPLPPSPCMAAFHELQHDTCERLHNNFFHKVTPETIAAADSKDDAGRLLAEYVEAEKQMHVLRTCLMEKGAAIRRSAAKKE
ncbi:hypothetical protein D6C81_05715 [Aureobasidium pullulans]|nr:hypothetical protein D6C81_05715 [Aureobasidium pullulans]